MTETQVLTIAMSLGISFIAVLTGVLMNNTRLGDVRDVIKAEVKAMEALITTRATASEMAALRILIERNHSEMMLRLSEIESRLTRLESDRKVIG